MKCPSCGKELSDGAKFCVYCGSKIEIKEEVKPNTVEKKADFDDDQTEIIFDKKIQKEKIKKGSKAPVIIAIILCVIMAGAAAAVVLYNNKSTQKTLEAQQKTGIETNENGDIVYNKGNHEYAHDELIEEGSDIYYFKEDGTMLKDDWAKTKGKYYYCGKDGKILKNQWVENEYYVNEYGEMLVNSLTPDGFFVGADGKYVPQEILDAMNNINTGGGSSGGGSNNGGGSNGGGSSSGGGGNGGGNIIATVERTQPRNEIVVDTSKAVWITGYETFTSYMDFDDDTNVDISIKYPIFGGQDQSEADAMNTCMNELTSDMEMLADTDITMEDAPRKYSITTSEISNIEANKINVILKGKLERSGKAAKDVRIRFIYDRSSRTAFVKD